MENKLKSGLESYVVVKKDGVCFKRVINFDPDGCMPGIHSISTHNFHIGRYGRCLYCVGGSKPVADVLVGVDE